MLTGQQLIAAIARLPTQPARGVAFRFVHLKYQNTPLSSLGSLRRGGRYNFAGAFPALYTSDSPITALRELKILTETATGLAAHKAEPQILLSIEYSLQEILDLTKPNHQSILGTNLQELTGVWLPINIQGQVAPTQELGAAVYASPKIEALKVSSAYEPNACNLVILTDKLSPSSFLEVYDKSGTIAAKIP